MGDILKSSFSSSKDLNIEGKSILNEGFFKNEISYLSLPSEGMAAKWNDVDWNTWVEDNSSRISNSRIHFKNKINYIYKGAFENWSADILVFEKYIDTIEEEGIFAGGINSIVLEEGVGSIGNGNFSNIFKLGSDPYDFHEGAVFIVNGDIGIIGEGVFSDANYNKIEFNGKIGEIKDHKLYLVPSFTNLRINHLRIPEGIKSLGEENFFHSHFGYLSLPSTLSYLNETTFRDSLVDILIVHNMDIDFEDRNIKHAYRKMIIETDEEPIIICHNGSMMEKYAKKNKYNCQNIVKIDEELFRGDNNIIYELKLCLNDYIKEYEDNYRVDYDFILTKYIDKRVEVLDLLYDTESGLNIELEDNKLMVHFNEGFMFDEDVHIELVLKDIADLDAKLRLGKPGKIRIEVLK